MLNKIKACLNVQKLTQCLHMKRKTLVTVVSILAGLLIIYFIFSIYCKNQQEKYSQIFHQSLIEEEKGNMAGSITGLEQIYNTKFAPSGVKSLASLRLAGILLNNGQSEKALEIYEDIAQTNRYDNYLQDLASLLASRLIVIGVDASQEKSMQENNLKKIEKFESKSKILRNYISEQKAIYLMKIGKLEESAKVLEKISTAKEASQTLKARASDLTKLVAAKGYTSKLSDNAKTPVKE